MDKRNLTDGTARWFDADKADFLGHTEAEEGGITHEEKLYHSRRSGMFFMERLTYGTQMGDQRECTEVTAEEAVSFLTTNNIDLPEWLGREGFE